MTTSLQHTLDRERAIYDVLAKPLLYQLAELHGLSIRDFASIFAISKGHAESILKHKVLPSLELAFRISRYFECAVDDLFGWRVEDTGERRPLLICLPGRPKLLRLNKYADRSALPLIGQVEAALKEQGGIEKLAVRLSGEGYK